MLSIKATLKRTVGHIKELGGDEAKLKEFRTEATAFV